MADKWYCEICGAEGKLHHGDPNDKTLIPSFGWIVKNRWVDAKVCIPCNEWLNRQEKGYLDERRRKWLLNRFTEKGIE